MDLRAKTFLTLHSHPIPSLEEVSAREVLREVRERVRSIAEGARVDVVAYCTCDHARLQRHEFVSALCVLVENAIRTSHEGQTVVVSARDAGDGESLWYVEDEGCGLTDDDFFGALGEVVTRDVPDVSFAREVVEHHDGLLRFESSDAGSTVTIWLPH